MPAEAHVETVEPRTQVRETGEVFLPSLAACAGGKFISLGALDDAVTEANRQHEEMRHQRDMVAARNEYLESLVAIDPNDPFDQLLGEIITLHRAKREDYASSRDVYQNFRRRAAAMHLDGYDALQVVVGDLTEKLQRAINLRGRSAQNETVQDTYLDIAVLGVLALGLSRDPFDYDDA